jgi:hypothetical protein
MVILLSLFFSSIIAISYLALLVTPATPRDCPLELDELELSGFFLSLSDDETMFSLSFFEVSLCDAMRPSHTF